MLPAPLATKAKPRSAFYTEEIIMPFINIRLVREVIAHDPARLKAEMAGNITRAVTEATGLSNGDVRVVFEEVAAADWYVGPSSVAQSRNAKT
jgi:4-oxalocrotonate tautomerase